MCPPRSRQTDRTPAQPEAVITRAANWHITLVNHACPFGTDVQRAPGLCRMTSSVFGGIAARTTNTETVVSLDERIAVGDPQCRVTITFGGAVAPTTWGHRYRPLQ